MLRAPAAAPAATLATLRLFLVRLFSFGSAGLVAELLLAKHVEDAWQLVPLVLLGLSLVVLGGYALVKRSRLLQVHQAIMLLFILTGGMGTYLHYHAKTEFALERSPSLRGSALMREAIKGTSPPILAPGAMIALGLLGLGWTWRHPALPSMGDPNDPQHR